MSTVITARGVSKRYLLSHKREGTPAYRTFREAVASRARRILSMRSNNNNRAATDSREEFWALRDVELQIEQGERVAIIGRNGAGKSTLLKILSRITEPTEGVVRIRGRLSSLLEVGTGFHPELTGRENIFLNGAVLGMSRAEVRRKFDDIVDFAEVERFLDTPIKRYSSGMYVRLAFAVSAYLEPDIIVLDEVLAVGDASFQKKCLTRMAQLASEGRTVLFVSHSMGAVRSMCNYGIVLEAGRASPKMPVDDAIATYLSRSGGAGNPKFPVDAGEVICLGVRLTQDGLEHEEFLGDRPIDILIRFHANAALNDFRIGFYLKTTLGDIIARALAADWKPENASIVAGQYELRARIPPNFLVAGNFLFELHCSRFGVVDYFGDSITIPLRIRQSAGYNVQHPGEEPFGMVHLDPNWWLHREGA